MFIIPQVGRIIRRDVLLIQIVPTLIVCAVLLVFTIIGWQNARRTLDAQRDQVVKEKVSQVKDSITQHMQANELLLQAGSGLFSASEAVTRDEWQRFYAGFDAQHDYTGVNVIGYGVVVPGNELSSFIASTQSEGFPNYTVTPQMSRPVYVPVMYAEQARPNSSTIMGFDMYSDPARRGAMEQARDSGELVMSNVAQLADHSDSGVILFMPVYNQGATLHTVGERRNALRGYVFVSVHINQLFDDIVLSNNKHFGYTVSEVTNNGNRQIYDSWLADHRHARDADQVASSKLEIFGQTWNVDYYASDDIVASSLNARPSSFLAAGVIISVITSIAVFLLIQYRTRIFALKEEYKLQEAKDELLSLASHQLRTPATGVKQYIGMVLDGFAGRLTKGQRELLHQANLSNERQLQIINEFLYVAKLGSGSITITEHQFDLASLIRNIVDEVAHEIKEKNHTVKVDVPDSAPIIGDEHSVRMIIENLISNALKYTKSDSKGKIEIALKETQDEHQIIVKDNGIGIDKKDMSQLFVRFSRIPNELSAAVSGSGIGLFLSQQLAERSGGEITVESEPNAGSTFILHLPRKSVKNITKKPDSA